MKDCFYNFLISIIIFINILFLINCEDSTTIVTTDSTESTPDDINCRRLIIDKKGKINIDNITENSKYNNTIKSIQLNDYFIIYDCWNETENQNDCKYNTSEDLDKNNSDDSQITDTSLGCSKKIAKGDKDNNICCHYTVKLENKTNNYGCLEINKYEFQRFKWAFSDYQLDKSELYNDSIIEIECNDKINKINIIFIILFLIIFISL